MLICIESDGELQISLRGLPFQFNGVVFSNQSKWATCFEDTALLLVVGSCV